MLRSYLRSLKSMQADLQQRPDAEELVWAARKLFAFYDRQVRLMDCLVGSEGVKTKPAYRQGRPRKQQRRYKPRTANQVLAILRESLEPMAAAAIQERLAAEFKSVTRQTMSASLNSLEQEGKVERIEAAHGQAWYLWRAVD